MNTLFDIEPVLPKGFSYNSEFITQDEERRLVETIQGFDLKQMFFHEYQAKRKVMSFGKGWSFSEQRLKEGNVTSEVFDFLLKGLQLI